MEEKKKLYAAPEMQAYQVKKANIIATSGLAQTESLTEEEFSW